MASFAALLKPHPDPPRPCIFLEQSGVLIQFPTRVLMPEGRAHQTISGAAISNNCDKVDCRESMPSGLLCLPSNSNEEDVSSCSSSETLPDARPSPADQGPLHNVISLREALPAKRGLSRYFAGKSQSFTSLAEVYSVVDLAKPENPFVKRRKTGADWPRNHPAACIRPRTYVTAEPTSLHHDAHHTLVDHRPVDQPTSIPFKSFSSPELQNASF